MGGSKFTQTAKQSTETEKMRTQMDGSNTRG